MDNKVIIGALLIAALAGGGGYYAGSKYGAGSPRGQFGRASFQGQGGQNGGQVRFSGGGAAFGEIISQDADSITVKLGGQDTDTNGGTGSKIILISESTEVMKSVSGSMSDLSVGTNVMVNGTQNSDGSISARTIQIRPDGYSFPPTRQGGPRQQ